MMLLYKRQILRNRLSFQQWNTRNIIIIINVTWTKIFLINNVIIMYYHYLFILLIDNRVLILHHMTLKEFLKNPVVFFHLFLHSTREGGCFEWKVGSCPKWRRKAFRWWINCWGCCWQAWICQETVWVDCWHFFPFPRDKKKLRWIGWMKFKHG